MIDVYLCVFVAAPGEHLLRSEEIISPGIAAKEVLSVEDENAGADYHAYQQGEQKKLQQVAAVGGNTANQNSANDGNCRAYAQRLGTKNQRDRPIDRFVRRGQGRHEYQSPDNYYEYQKCDYAIHNYGRRSVIESDKPGDMTGGLNCRRFLSSRFAITTT